MKKALVFPAKGIGDAILMMIASHHLLVSGFKVTTFHPSLKELSDWFPGHFFSDTNSAILPVSFLKEADLILLENDNGPFCKHLIELRRKGQLSSLSVFYPSYRPSKHGPLDPKDQVFDSTATMADNLSYSVAKILKSPLSSKNNGMTPLSSLEHRRKKNRVIIHPTSTQSEKNWLSSRYLALASLLKREGYEVSFTVSPAEYEEWEERIQGQFDLPLFSTLADLATYVYESGYMIGNDSLTGHLASNLNIPTLIISNDAKRMKLWRPGWLKGEVLTPASFIPNWKGLRLRERHWQKWISVARVLRSFHKITHSL